MNSVFNNTGYYSTNFTLELGDKFDTSKVISMAFMFNQPGHSSIVFKLDLGDIFDTSNAACMNSMFLEARYSNSSFRLDCSNWNVDKITAHTDFNKNVTSKIIEPQWKN